MHMYASHRSMEGYYRFIYYKYCIKILYQVYMLHINAKKIKFKRCVRVDLSILKAVREQEMRL